MKRSELKALIKECVVEVLHEGIGDNATSVLRESAAPRASQKRRGKLPRKSAAKQRPEHVVDVDTNISTDPIMQSIFSDTAATTLQSQVASDRRGSVVVEGSDRAAQFMAENEPEDVFDGASNWAALAFNK
jgi:hypothetical protein